MFSLEVSRGLSVLQRKLRSIPGVGEVYVFERYNEDGEKYPDIHIKLRTPESFSEGAMGRSIDALGRFGRRYRVPYDFEVDPYIPR